ncbi:hypothetical protein ACCS96_47145, partial [Rhizobium ruizarguesonis]
MELAAALGSTIKRPNLRPQRRLTITRLKYKLKSFSLFTSDGRLPPATVFLPSQPSHRERFGYPM